MLRCIWHALFVGHRMFEHSSQSFNGTGKVFMPIRGDEMRMEVYGFTDVDFVCECGAHQTVRMIGQRTKLSEVDDELAQLRKMIKE